MSAPNYDTYYAPHATSLAPKQKKQQQNRRMSQSKATLESHRSKLLAMMETYTMNPHYKQEATIHEARNHSFTTSEASSSARSSMDSLPMPRIPSFAPRHESYASSFTASDSMPATPQPEMGFPTPPSSNEAHEEINHDSSKDNLNHSQHSAFEEELNLAFQDSLSTSNLNPTLPPPVASLQKPGNVYDPTVRRISSGSNNNNNDSNNNYNNGNVQHHEVQRPRSEVIPSESQFWKTSPRSVNSLPQYVSTTPTEEVPREDSKLLHGWQVRDDPFQDPTKGPYQHLQQAVPGAQYREAPLPTAVVTSPRIKRKPVNAHASSADRYSASAATAPPSKKSFPTKVKVLVLGAGPTGLGAAHQLQQSGCEDWLLLDSMNRPGGMAVTEVDQHGFRWDLGGHVIHSRYAAFDKVAAMHKDWVHPNRGGWVRVKNQWVPTPIQQSLGNLQNGKKIIKELQGKGKGAAKPEKEAKNLGQYYRNTFGKELNETFFEPFNKKQWAWNLEDLDHTWTSLRSGSKIANVPEATDALIQLKEPKDTTKFPYPRLGTGSLWKSIASTLPADKQRYNATVKRIDLKNKKAILTSGETITFSRCISTIPLSGMLKLVADQRPDLGEMVPNLKHSSTTVVGLGFKGPLPEVLKGKTWIFSADSEVEFHRASVTSNFSSAMADGGDSRMGPRWSIMFETATSGHRVVNTKQEHLVKRHLAELQRWGAIQPNQQPLSVWYKHLKLGYPLPFVGRDDLLSSSTYKILPELEQAGVVSRGRFGGWRYESSNQDCAFVQGVEATDLVLKGKKEKEYWPDRPDLVKLKPLSEEDDESLMEKTPLVVKETEKPKRRGPIQWCKAWVQANYFVIQDSPDLVLPYIPTDEEKMGFLEARKSYVILFGILALASSSAGLWLFALGGPAFYWFAAATFLGQVTSAIFLLSSALGKSFDLKAHEQLKRDYGVYSNEKNVPTVDIYLTCCKEPLEVLENTYGYVAKMDYPKDKLNIYILDDGAMDEVKALADKFQFHYIRRPNRGHLKKAGNLRHAYATTNGDYFMILDADFCPRHDFLLETIPMMRKDDKLAVIQTPQFFHTSGATGKQTWVERGAGAVQELFYRLIMTSRNTWGAAICAGSCALYRRESLKKLGGTAPLESSEDIWTGFYLIQDGWKVQYLPIVLTCGACPDTARALFSQQLRWCEGSCGLVLSMAFWRSTFTWKQKALYFSGLLYYLDQALAPFILPLPSIFLVWIRPGKLLYYNLAFAVPTLLYSYWLNRWWSRAKHAKSIGFVNPIQSYSYFFAFKDRIFNTKYDWIPTGDAKAHKSNRYRNSRIVCIVWTFSNTAALAAGITVSWIAGHPWYDFVPIIALQAYSVHNLIPFMLAK